MEGRNKEEDQGKKRDLSTATTTTKKTPPVAAPPTVAIHNPYASGRTSIGVHNKRSVTTAAGSSHNKNAATHNQASCAQVKATTSGNLEVPNPPRCNENSQDKEPEQPAYWERLPSRIVSFTSAEVLTVTECLKDSQSIAKLYCDQGRAVRVTGILDSRSIRRDNPNDETSFVVVMEISDPMATTTKASAERAKAQYATPRTSAAFQKRQSILRTPAASSKRRNSGIGYNKDRMRTMRKKRPWFVSSTPTPGKQTLATKNSDIITLSTLRVIVDPKSVVGADKSLAAAVVGSFITVIGEFDVEVRPISSRGDTNVNGNSREKSLRYELEARTLRVINNHLGGNDSVKATTDMALYNDALVSRRKSMYERYYYSSHQRVFPQSNEPSSQKKGGIDNGLLLQGCGPPPYDAYYRELTELDTSK